MADLPLIGITMGDPAGIGPEIIVKALREKELYEICRPVVIGDQGVLSAVVSAHSPDFSLNCVSVDTGVDSEPGRISMIEVSGLKEEDMIPGRPTVDGGKAMVRYILKAADMTLTGQLDAMVTCPINKALMQQAGYAYEGHTQLIAERAGAKDFVMMLAGQRLRVALVTIHCALREVPSMLTEEGVYRTIHITARALREEFGLHDATLAVAALNPHGGESGLFGVEERQVIEPAVKRARREGVHVEGPFPPDTLFFKAASGRFEAVIAMYHDQGLIPLKLLHFSDAVNVTLGLPIIRTSVDHGTAYDIAGKGKADPSSLKAAVRMAATMAENRRTRTAKG